MKNFECRDLFLQRFRNLWQEEYLLRLRDLTQDLYQSAFNNVIGVDDVVLIKNQAKSRPNWSLDRMIFELPREMTHVYDRP